MATVGEESPTAAYEAIMKYYDELFGFFSIDLTGWFAQYSLICREHVRELLFNPTLNRLPPDLKFRIHFAALAYGVQSGLETLAMFISDMDIVCKEMDLWPDLNWKLLKKKLRRKYKRLKISGKSVVHAEHTAQQVFSFHREEILHKTAEVEPEKLIEVLMDEGVIDEFSVLEVLTKKSRREEIAAGLWLAVEKELGKDQKKLTFLRAVLERVCKDSVDALCLSIGIPASASTSLGVEDNLAYQAVLKHYDSILEVVSQVEAYRDLQGIKWIARAYRIDSELAKYLKHRPDLKLRVYLAGMVHKVRSDENRLDMFLRDLRRMLMLQTRGRSRHVNDVISNVRHTYDKLKKSNALKPAGGDGGKAMDKSQLNIAQQGFRNCHEEFLHKTADVEPEKLIEVLMDEGVVDEFSVLEVLTKKSGREEIAAGLWLAVEKELGKDQKKLTFLRAVLERVCKDSVGVDIHCLKSEIGSTPILRMQGMYEPYHASPSPGLTTMTLQGVYLGELRSTSPTAGPSLSRMHVKDSQIAYQAVMKHFESIVNIFNQLGVHEAVEWIEHCQAHNRTIEQGQVIAKFLKPELKLRAYLAVMAHEVLCDENEFDQFLLDLKRMANGHRAHFRFKSCYAKMNAVIKEVKSYYMKLMMKYMYQELPPLPVELKSGYQESSLLPVAAKLSPELHVISRAHKLFLFYKIDLFCLLKDPAQYTDRLVQFGLLTPAVANSINTLNAEFWFKIILLFGIECQVRNDERNYFKLCSVLKEFPATVLISTEMSERILTREAGERFETREAGETKVGSSAAGETKVESSAAALDQSIIVSTDFEDLMDQLAALNNPIFHAFCLFLNGVICEESLAEIFVSTEPQECLWNEVKYLICRDDQKHSLFLEMFKNDPHTAKIASQLQDLKVRAELEIVAEESFEIKDSRKLILFDRSEEYGFKLEVPSGALLEKEGCVVKVKACLPRVAPVGLDLVSAIYEISTPCSKHHPLKPVDIEIEHCAVIESEDQLSQLSFLTSKGDLNSSLHFNQICSYASSCGKFSLHSCYGRISLHSFSWFTISWLGRHSHTQYSAKVYIEHTSLVRKAIYFILLRNLEAHLKAVTDHYATFSSEECFVPDVVFSRRSKFLSLRVGREVMHEGWKIWPNYYPAKIRKQAAKSFNPQRNRATCKLFAKPESESAPSCLYSIELEGVDEPECVTVQLSHEIPVSPNSTLLSQEASSIDSRTSQVTVRCTSQPTSPIEAVPSSTVMSQDVPTLGPEHLDRLAKLVKDAKDKWKGVGEALCFLPQELGDIERAKGKGEDYYCLQELLLRWLKRAPPFHFFPHVKQLADALRAAGEHRTAYELEHSDEAVALSTTS